MNEAFKIAYDRDRYSELVCRAVAGSHQAIWRKKRRHLSGSVWTEVTKPSEGRNGDTCPEACGRKSPSHLKEETATPVRKCVDGSHQAIWRKKRRHLSGSVWTEVTKPSEGRNGDTCPEACGRKSPSHLKEETATPVRKCVDGSHQAIWRKKRRHLSGSVWTEACLLRRRKRTGYPNLGNRTR